MATDEFKFKMYLHLPGHDGYQQVSFNDSGVGTELRQFSKFVYILHAFGENPLTSAWISLLTKYWTQNGAAVIVPDYSYDNKIGYFQVMANVRTVGMAVGHSIVNWDVADKTLMVGFSLGGQAIAHVALFVNQNSDKKVAECHGLDPAGPYFIGGPNDAKLDRSDCAIVQVIHMTAPISQALTLLGVAFGKEGTDEKSGHCDFWVNCGYDQSMDCTQGTGASVSNGDLESVMFDGLPTCAHSRSTVIYMNQLYGKCNFTSETCDDCGNKNVDCKSTGQLGANTLPPNSDCNSDMDQNFILFTQESGNKCDSYINGSFSNPLGLQV